VIPVFHWSCPSVLSEKHQQSQWYHSVSLILSLCFIWKTSAITVVPQCFTDLVLVFYLKNTSNHSGTTVFHWSCPSVLSEKHQQSQWYHSFSLILSLCFIWKTPAITVVPKCFTDLVLVFYLKNTSNHSGTSVSLILSLCFIWKTPAITVVPVFHWSCPSVLSEKHQQSQISVTLW
jgi:uncharacterized protein YqhQ